MAKILIDGQGKALTYNGDAVVITNVSPSTRNITSNGVHSVIDYTTIDVQVPSNAPSFCRAYEIDSNGQLIASTTYSALPNFSGVQSMQAYSLANAFTNNTAIAEDVQMDDLIELPNSYSCYQAFYNCTGITGVSMNSLETISGQYACYQMFQGDTNITFVDLRSLETISGQYACQNMFSGDTALTTADLGSLETISGNYACQYMFQNCSRLSSVDLSNLKSIVNDNSCYYMFYNCALSGILDLSTLFEISGNYACQYMFSSNIGITSVDLSNLVSIYGYSACYGMFYNCTGITSVDLSNLRSISYSESAAACMFQNCTSLQTVTLGKLLNIGGRYGANYMFNNCPISSIDMSSLRCTCGCYYMFYNCPNLTSVSFDNLVYLQTYNNEFIHFQYAFGNCTSLQSVSFPSLIYVPINYNNSFNSMLYGCSNVTVHFPANWETDMLTWSNVINGFSGTNTTVLFDLPNASTSIDLTELTEIKGRYVYYNMFNQSTGITSVDLSNVENISGYDAAYYMFANCPNLTSADLSSLENISENYACYDMFYNCTGLTFIDLSSLKTISGQYACSYMFSGCTGLTSIDLSSLETVSGDYACRYLFSGDTALTTVDLSGLKTVSGRDAFRYSFNNCSNIVTVDLGSLETVTGRESFREVFSGNTSLTNVDLHSLTTVSGNSACYRMFYNCTGITGALDLSNLTTVTSGSVSDMFRGCTGLTSVDLSSFSNNPSYLNTMFYNCTGLTSVDLSGIKVITNYNDFNNIFNGSTNITSVDFSGVKFTYSGSSSGNYSLFQYFPNITSVDFSGLQQVANNCYPLYRCFYSSKITVNPFVNVTVWNYNTEMFTNSKLVDGTFPKLAYIAYGLGNSFYANCTDMVKLDFPALGRIYYDNTFRNGFISGCTNPNFTKITFPMLTNIGSSTAPFGATGFATGTGHSIEVHFRKDMQTTISALSNYSTCWGASAILFDLVGTIVVNGDTYIRQGSCNESGYIAWQKSGSSITLANGKIYYYPKQSIGYFQTNDTTLEYYPGAMYYWAESGAVTYDDTNSVRFPSLQPQVGECGYNYNTSYVTPDPTFEVVSNTNNIFVYTVDSAEPEVGDTVYSDIQGTVLGTISSIS